MQSTITVPLMELSSCDVPGNIPERIHYLPQPSSSHKTVTPIPATNDRNKSFVELSDRIRSWRSPFKNKKTRWLNPEASVGKFCGTKGKFRYWEAKGTVQEAFTKLGDEIKALLDQSCGPVPASSQVIYEIFMIGRSPETSSPHIMFSCKRKEPRKEAMEIVQKSGILDRYPGIATGHWDFPPHINQVEFKASEGDVESAANPLSILVPLYSHDTSKSAFATSDVVIAMRLHLEMSSGGWVDSPKATVGSTVHIAGRALLLSVAHAFFSCSSSTPDVPSADDADGDSEFEFGGLDDEDDNSEDESTEFTSSGSITSEGKDGDSSASITLNEKRSENLLNSPSNVSNMPHSQFRRKESERPPKINPDRSNILVPSSSSRYIARSILASDELDYTLLEIAPKVSWNVELDTLPILSAETVTKIPPVESRALVITGSSGMVHGKLSGIPSYLRLLRSRKFQKVYTMQLLDGKLVPGDSGSVVFSVDRKQVYGHIVVGSSVSNVAYIIPATDVLADIESREFTKSDKSDTAISLPSMEVSSGLLISDRISARGALEYGNLLGQLNSEIETDDQASAVESDIESILSENHSIASSRSSMSDVQISALQKFVDLIYQSELEALIPVAILKVGPDRFKRNFKRILKQYGHQLRNEASNTEETRAAGFICSSSTRIAMAILSRNESAQDSTNTILQKPYNMNKEDDVMSNESDTEGESDSETPGGEFEKLEQFLISGKAFALLYSTFEQWVTPKKQLDEFYGVRSRDYREFFKVGRVFSTLWTEQMENDPESQNSVSVVTYGDSAYTKVRRFIVIKQWVRSCSCLPVTSYGRKGVNKPGIVLAEHGFIYSHKKPESVHGLGAKSLRIILCKGSSQLTEPSLINYSRTYHVEANLKVKDIGQLDPKSIKHLKYYYHKICVGEEDSLLPTDPSRSTTNALAGVGSSLHHPVSTPIDNSSSGSDYHQYTPPSIYPPSTLVLPSTDDSSNTSNFHKSPYPGFNPNYYNSYEVDYSTDMAMAPFPLPDYNPRQNISYSTNYSHQMPVDRYSQTSPPATLSYSIPPVMSNGSNLESGYQKNPTPASNPYLEECVRHDPETSNK